MLENDNGNLLFEVLDGNNPVVIKYYKKFFLMFTLKMYTWMFIVQTYLMTSILTYNQSASFGHLVYSSNVLKFAFDNAWIERNFTSKFGADNFLDDLTNKIEEKVFYFYRVVWGECRLNLDNQSELINNVLEQFLKFSLWGKINGKNLNVFKSIGEAYKNKLSNCLQQADNLFANEFKFVDSFKPTKVAMLIKDKAALNIVRAVCFMMVKITHQLIKSIHSLQNSGYIKKHTSMTHVLPGIIDLINNMNVAREQFRYLKQLFIGFNDEFDSLCRAIKRTKFSVMSMFRDIYVKISYEWYCQMDKFVRMVNGETNPADSPKLFALIHFNMIVGTHFIVRFQRPFRKDYVYLRKKIQDLEKRLAQLNGFDFSR